MKRFFSLLCVFMLIVSLAVPAMASEIDTVSGVWQFNDVINGATNSAGGAMTFGNLSFTCGGDSFVSIYVNGSGTTMKYTRSSGTVKWAIRDTWENETVKTIDFGENPQTVSHDFYLWLVDNAHKMGECDGTSCSILDADLDGYCEDCHMMLMTTRTAVTPSRWPAGVPLLPVTNERTVDYVYRSAAGNVHALRLYIIDDTTTVAARYTDGIIRFTFDTGVGLTQYIMENGGWVAQTNYDIEYDYQDVQHADGFTALYSSVDIYDSEGELFFPPRLPLWMEVGETVKVEATPMWMTILRAFSTLVLCGIGLLVSLIGLKLLSRVLYRFLG